MVVWETMSFCQVTVDIMQTSVLFCYQRPKHTPREVCYHGGQLKKKQPCYRRVLIFKI